MTTGFVTKLYMAISTDFVSCSQVTYATDWIKQWIVSVNLCSEEKNSVNKEKYDV